MMRHGSPLSQRGQRRDRRRDDRLDSLKRRVAHLARLEGDLVLLADGLFLVCGRAAVCPGEIVRHLRERGVLDRPTLERCVALLAPLLPIDAQTLGKAHRDLKVLAEGPSLALAREHRRLLSRYGTI